MYVYTTTPTKPTPLPSSSSATFIPKFHLHFSTPNPNPSYPRQVLLQSHFISITLQLSIAFQFHMHLIVILQVIKHRRHRFAVLTCSHASTSPQYGGIFVYANTYYISLLVFVRIGVEFVIVCFVHCRDLRSALETIANY